MTLPRQAQDRAVRKSNNEINGFSLCGMKHANEMQAIETSSLGGGRGSSSSSDDAAVAGQQLGNGTSIGNRKVVLFNTSLTTAAAAAVASAGTGRAGELRLVVTTAGGMAPALSLFGAYKPCPSQ